MKLLSQVTFIILLILGYITTAEIVKCRPPCAVPFYCFWCTCPRKDCYNDDCTFKGIVSLSAPSCQPILLKNINDNFGALLDATKTAISTGLSLAAGFGGPGANAAAIAGGFLLDAWIPDNGPDYITQQGLDEQWNDLLECIDMAVDEERGTQAEYDFTDFTTRMENILEHMEDGLNFENDLDALFDELIAKTAIWVDQENYFDLGKVIALIPAYTLAINVFYATSTTHLGYLLDESNCPEYNSGLQHYKETLLIYVNYITNALETFDTYYKPTGYYCYDIHKTFQITWNEGNSGHINSEEFPDTHHGDTVPSSHWPRLRDCGINSCNPDAKRVFNDVIKPTFRDFRISTNLPSLYQKTIHMKDTIEFAMQVSNDCFKSIFNSPSTIDTSINEAFVLENTDFDTLCLQKKKSNAISNICVQGMVTDDKNMQWKLVHVQNDNIYFKLRNEGGNCLMIRDHNFDIELGGCNAMPNGGLDAYLWKYYDLKTDGSFKLRNKKSGLCLNLLKKSGIMAQVCWAYDGVYWKMFVLNN